MNRDARPSSAGLGALLGVLATLSTVAGVVALAVTNQEGAVPTIDEVALVEPLARPTTARKASLATHEKTLPRTATARPVRRQPAPIAVTRSSR